MLKRLNPSVSIGMRDLLDQIRPVASCLPCPSGRARTRGQLSAGTVAPCAGDLCARAARLRALRCACRHIAQVFLKNASDIGEWSWGGWSEPGREGSKVPILLLVVLGCCCMGAVEIAGELRGKGVVVTEH